MKEGVGLGFLRRVDVVLAQFLTLAPWGPFQARSFLYSMARIGPFPDRLFNGIFNNGKTAKESDAGTEMPPASPPRDREK